MYWRFIPRGKLRVLVVMAALLACPLLLPSEASAQEQPGQGTAQPTPGSPPGQPQGAQGTAAGPTQDFMKAEVVAVVEEGERQITPTVSNPYQLVHLRILDGDQEGEEITIEHGGGAQLTEDQKVSAGETVVLSRLVQSNGNVIYFIADKYRLSMLLYVAAGFAVLVILIAGWKGVGSLLGLAISLAVILKLIIPQIIAGTDPVLITIAGSALILFTATYLAHGISRQTTVALGATLSALVITGAISIWLVNLAGLTGIGDGDASSLLLGPTRNIDLQGLLLAGIIIGTLGALNDVTVTQAAAVFELSRTDRNLRFRQLASKGFSVGREHIVSLVNTLVLAYAGTSLVIFIFLDLNPSDSPYWLIVNSELIATEVIRTAAGSTGLILAVPITTVLAAWYCGRRSALAAEGQAEADALALASEDASGRAEAVPPPRGRWDPERGIEFERPGGPGRAGAETGPDEGET